MTPERFTGRLEAAFNPFSDDYLAEIIRATATAWKRMKHPPKGEKENAITRRLAGWLQKDPDLLDVPFDVVPQYSLLDQDGRELGRLDLYFKYRSSHRDYFAFEAKRLHVTYPRGRFSFEYTTYTDTNGMGAFLEGYYSKELPACGMLGYVMDGKSDGAWIGLGQRIEAERQILRIRAGSTFVGSTLSSAVADALEGTLLGETDHDLTTHRLRMLHLVLPVRS